MNPAAPAFDASALTIPADGRAILRTTDGVLSRADLIARAEALAARLPSGTAALNLCERRENYLVALLALDYREQVCLMPPSRVPAVLDEVEAAHAGSFRVDDALVTATAGNVRARAGTRDRVLDPQRVVAVAYTSGSTGRPKPNRKTWLAFAGPAHFNAHVLRGSLPGGPSVLPWLVATVPSQHMYGMEFTAMLPLLAGMGVHASHPLFPSDIADALGQVSEPRVLVSTPVHLRALLESGVTMPPLAAVVSATAPLTADLAVQIEERFSTRVTEYFGSTETCVIASRRTAREGLWSPYRGLRLMPASEETLVEAPWLEQPVPMQDVFEIDTDGGFRVVGRSADMIEVAGKRTSLADLTRRLLGVPGVRDAVVLQPASEPAAPVRRLVAFVVTDDDVTTQSVAASLADQVDPVFIPRPIVRVDRLPRNDVGKLPRDQLLRLVRDHALDTRGT
jgi:acyl-coenzyme A synthetase/AMP-(fatty) acid ligase